MTHGPYTTTAEVLIDGAEQEAMITFVVHPGAPETRIQPPEYPEAEITDITIDGKPVDPLRCEEIRETLDLAELLREANEQEQAWADDEADYRRDERRMA